MSAFVIWSIIDYSREIKEGIIHGTRVGWLNFKNPFGMLFLSSDHQLQLGDQSLNFLYAESLWS